MPHMNMLTRHWRFAARVVGSLLVLVGLFFTYWWFYKLVPLRCTCDRDWRATHSEREYWEQVQAGIRRGIWAHDDGWAVGYYGDRSWAEWIMTHVRSGTTMCCLGADFQHSDLAMRLITNQGIGDDADAWLDWWKQNGDKSQVEWIVDGFRQTGLVISSPPTPEQLVALLTLLGTPRDPESESHVEHLKYNAFRFLRDSGFEPVEFALSHRTTVADIDRGLLEYVKQEHRAPAALGLGILPLTSKPEPVATKYLPQLLTVEFQATAYALTFGSLLIGGAILWWSVRRRPSPATSAERSTESPASA